MNKSNKFSPEMRERAVRMVQEHRGEYPSLWAAVNAISPNHCYRAILSSEPVATEYERCSLTVQLGKEGVSLLTALSEHSTNSTRALRCSTTVRPAVFLSLCRSGSGALPVPAK
jgi:hypothetical protein